MSEDRKKLFREEMPDGSTNEYEVDKFSDDGQRAFFLLGKVQEDLQKQSVDYLILKESEESLIQKIRKELSDKTLIQEKSDGNKKDGKK